VVDEIVDFVGMGQLLGGEANEEFFEPVRS